MKTSTKIIIGLSIALALCIWVSAIVIKAQQRVIHNNDLLHQSELEADSILLANAKWQVRELDSAFSDLQAKHLLLVNKWANYKFKWTVTDTLKDAELQRILINKIEGKNDD